MSKFEEMNIKIIFSSSGQQGEQQEQEFSLAAPPPSDDENLVDTDSQELFEAPPPDDIGDSVHGEEASISEFSPSPPDIHESGYDSSFVDRTEDDASPPAFNDDSNFILEIEDDINTSQHANKKLDIDR